VSDADAGLACSGHRRLTREVYVTAFELLGRPFVGWVSGNFNPQQAVPHARSMRPTLLTRFIRTSRTTLPMVLPAHSPPTSPSRSPPAKRTKMADATATTPADTAPEAGPSSKVAQAVMDAPVNAMFAPARTKAEIKKRKRTPRARFSGSM